MQRVHNSKLSRKHSEELPMDAVLELEQEGRRGAIIIIIIILVVCSIINLEQPLQQLVPFYWLKFLYINLSVLATLLLLIVGD